MKPAFQGQLVFAVICSAAFLAGRPASAQCDAQREVMELNRQAMEAYSNLEVDAAVAALQQATQTADPCIPAAVMARTFANLGVVHVGGMMANAEGIEAFRRALCLDPSVQLDPLTSTPDIQTTFRLAQAQNQQQGCPAGYASPTPPTPTPPTPIPPTPIPPTPTPPPASFELFRHIPVQEQQRMFPVPLYIEVNPAVQVGEVALNYRVAGESQFTRIVMESLGSNAFAVTIPCDTIALFDPSWIEYYMEILAPDGRTIGSAPNEGSERPHRTNMVEALSAARPAVPGQPPPSQCINCGDLPPGAPVPPECQQQAAGGRCESGFTCDVNDDCPGEEMSCTDGCCVGEGGGGGGGRRPSGAHRPYAYFQAAVGWGGGLVLATDDVPWRLANTTVPDNALLRAAGSGNNNGTDCPQQRTTGDNVEGDDDPARGGIVGADWGTSACWHQIQATGFGYGAGHVRLYAGGYIIPQLSVGLTFRVQFGGFSSDSHMIWALGLRARYHIIQTERMELSVGAQVQIYGMMQVFLNLTSGGQVEDRAWRTGGYEAIGFTISYAYYFIRQVGIYAELTSDFTLPIFMWNTEISVGPAFRF